MLIFKKDLLSYYDVYKTDNNIYNTIPEKSDNEDNHYLSLLTNDYKRIGKMPSAKWINITKSQDINKGFGNLQEDGELFVNDNPNIILAGIKPNFNISLGSRENIMNTQIFGSSDVINPNKRNCVKNYLPFYDINAIRSRKERIRSNVMDLSSRQSLRNDYDF